MFLFGSIVSKWKKVNVFACKRAYSCIFANLVLGASMDGGNFQPCVKQVGFPMCSPQFTCKWSNRFTVGSNPSQGHSCSKVRWRPGPLSCGMTSLIPILIRWCTAEQLTASGAAPGRSPHSSVARWADMEAWNWYWDRCSHESWQFMSSVQCSELMWWLEHAM